MMGDRLIIVWQLLLLSTGGKLHFSGHITIAVYGCTQGIWMHVHYLEQLDQCVVCLLGA